MANFFEKKDRNIIPNWRSFENTTKLGELNGSKSIKLDSSFKPDISDLLENWDEHQTIGMAGDILGVALVCNQETNPIVQEVSKFVIKNRDIATPAIIDAANNVLKPKETEIVLNLDISNNEQFNNRKSLFEIFVKINSLKNKLRNSPYNPIYWVEIARYYSILGQDEKAKRAIKNAYYLAPENRFILRSISRFFIHIGDFEQAHDIIRKSNLTKFDPWLMATEIAIATLRERNSVFTKSGLLIVNSGSYHPFNLSELSSAIGTVELKNANVGKSKKLFEKSLLNPNDNALAQAEWASQEERNLIHLDLDKFKLVNSFEANARENFEKGMWQKSIDDSKNWFFDQPFSKMGILFGNEVASRKLKDDNQAVEIAKLGLLSHPNDAHLLNNIIYSLCIQNKIDEANQYLNDVKKEDLNSSNFSGICLTATRGLLAFRSKNFELGRKLYLESIEIANSENNAYLSSLAFINYVREEILANEQDVSEAIPRLEKISKNNIGKDIANDAKEVIELYRKQPKKIL